MGDEKIHRNDMYGDLNKEENTEQPAIPAATVVLMREPGDGEVEVLMLQKNQNISFGGMWVFPGGRIDDGDYEQDGDLEAAARNAVTRDLPGIAPKSSITCVAASTSNERSAWA